MEDIRATTRVLSNTIRERENILQTGNVSWADLAEKDKQIESYKKGLAKLKSYRETYFPNWKSIATEE